MVWRPPVRLIVAATAFIALTIAFIAAFWVLAILTAIIAIYLLLWAVIAKGFWCRDCKKFPLRRPVDRNRQTL